MPWKSLSRRRSDIELAVRRWLLMRRAAASGHDAGAVLSAIFCRSTSGPDSRRSEEAVCFPPIEAPR